MSSDPWHRCKTISGWWLATGRLSTGNKKHNLLLDKRPIFSSQHIRKCFHFFLIPDFVPQKLLAWRLKYTSKTLVFCWAVSLSSMSEPPKNCGSEACRTSWNHVGPYKPAGDERQGRLLTSGFCVRRARFMSPVAPAIGWLNRCLPSWNDKWFAMLLVLYSIQWSHLRFLLDVSGVHVLSHLQETDQCC